MTSAEVLSDAFGRLPDLVRGAVRGLDADELSARPGGSANSIAWLIWHLTRVEDSHLAEAFGHEQVWLAGGVADRWDLPLDHGDTGYGHSGDEVDAVRVASAQQLLDYFDTVHRLARDLVAGVDEQDLHRVVDEGWDPPVTLLVRLVSVLDDAVQHAGQAAYARGIILADRP
ncbi:mycothiol transferase [Arthrobacter pityocampae]|uniref:mycothiol transferase n=1 Tax=Arthrobacter pityocampae TaxID=547334 RepID=UPI0037351A7C